MAYNSTKTSPFARARDCLKAQGLCSFPNWTCPLQIARMVSTSQIFTSAVLALAAASGSVQALEQGDYYRPTGSEVSGFVGTTAAYRRSPCPALNTLANHGYLPRDGKNITHDMLTDAIENVYNIGPAVAAILVATLPNTISLDYLGTHNLIEHDASMVHSDFYFGADPVTVNTTLVNDVLSRANSDNRIGVDEIAAVRKDRLTSCKANNPTCTFGVKQQTLAFLEAGVLLLGLGAKADDQAISVDHATSFLVNEKIPGDWTRSSSVVSLVDCTAIAARLKLKSLLV